MPTRTARTAWTGTLEQGSGKVELTSGGIGTYDVRGAVDGLDEAQFKEVAEAAYGWMPGAQSADGHHDHADAGLKQRAREDQGGNDEVHR